MDPNTGFDPQTRTFHSLRPPPPLPPKTTPLSAATYALSLHSSTNPTALIDASTKTHISYTQFFQQVTTLSNNLITKLHLSKNDVVFILSPNSTKIPILYFSLLSIGATICPANPLSTRPELLHQINLTKPLFAFATSDTASKLRGHVDKIILIDSSEFDELTTSQELSRLGVTEPSQDDVAAILFSSGTTGGVKGVELTHRNLIAIVANMYYLRVERKERVVGLYAVPYFHVFGFHLALKSVALGETVVVMERFELRRMLRAVEEFKVTVLGVVPPVVVAMVKSGVTDEFDLKSLEAVGSGAAPLSVGLIRAFGEKFPGLFLSQGYGMTETSGGAFRPITPDESRRWGSVGKLTGDCMAKIVDPDTGVSLPPGKKGELWIKGPTVMKGYVGNPKANSETLVEGGWLKTGDICYIDDQGFLFVVDRLKEMIKYKGYQVAPAELEQLLLSHPDIVDAAVIPYPDEEAGQIPLAFVVRRSQSNLDAPQIIEFIQKQVAPYKKIRRVVFVSSIPKTPSGKILRKELKNITLPESKL